MRFFKISLLICFFSLFIACGNDEESEDLTSQGNSESADEGPASGKQAPPPLSCNIKNFEEYLYDEDKLDDLIDETGKGCNLKNADFKNRVFEVRRIQQAINVANGERSIETHPSFKEADLRGANFSHADLTEVRDLRTADLQGAKYNSETKFPEANFAIRAIDFICGGLASWCDRVFDPKDHGMILLDESSEKAEEAEGEEEKKEEPSVLEDVITGT